MLDDMPLPHSDLSDWRFFVFQEFGSESPAFAYLDLLCRRFGADCLVNQEPELFLSHVAFIGSNLSI